MTRRHRDGGGWEELAGYSRAVRRFGHIAVSGTTAKSSDGRAEHLGDTHGQALVALQRAIAAMQALGGRLEDVVRTRVYLAPGADWNEAAGAHAEVMGSVAPANTMIYVAGLIGEGFLVEVELDAEIGVDIDSSR
jgi:enamine deaminase RidA (YjgF/YER057c/UK114 family)